MTQPGTCRLPHGFQGGERLTADPGAARELLYFLMKSRSILAGYRVAEIIARVGAIGDRFLDPKDPLRAESEERVRDDGDLPEPMVHAVIDGMARDWVPERLTTLVGADFPDPAVLDELRPGSGGDLVRAVGDRLAFHLGSGNVPGVGVTSLIRSLLVKTPVLLKPGRGDRALPDLFARSLAESSPELASAVAVVYWQRGKGEKLEELALETADRVVAYGGNPFLDDLRKRTPATTPFVAYRHRLSMGAVGRKMLGRRETAESIAVEAASAVAMFDNGGCVSPRIIWVEDGASLSASQWAALLASRLSAIEAELPTTPAAPELKSTLQQLLGVSELKRAAGGEHRTFTGSIGSWAVFFDPDATALERLPPGRSVIVKPIARLEALGETLPPFRPYLQSFALAVSEERRPGLAELLAASGVSRVTTFARLPWPPAWWRHDGTGPLASLVSWVSLEP